MRRKVLSQKLSDPRSQSRRDIKKEVTEKKPEESRFSGEIPIVDLLGGTARIAVLLTNNERDYIRSEQANVSRSTRIDRNSLFPMF